MRTRSAPLVSLVTMVALALTASPVTAHTWTAARSLTTSGGAAAWPNSLAVTGPATAVAAYREIVGGKVAVFTRTTSDSGLTWSPRHRLSASSAAFATRVTIAADGQDVSAVWVEGGAACARGTASCHLMYATSTDGGADFRSPILLNDDSFPGFSQVVRSGSRTLVAWSSWRLGRINANLIDGGTGNLRHLGTTSFHPFGNICKVGPGTVCKDGLASAALGDGVAYVSFFTSEHSLRMVRTSDDGLTWGASTAISSSTLGWDGTSIAAGGSDALVTYSMATAGHQWLVARSTMDAGVHWSAPTAVSPRTAQDSFAPVAYRDADGSYAVAFARCNSQACPRTAVYLRTAASATGPWGATEKVPGGGTFGVPTGIASTARMLVMSVRFNATASITNVVATAGG